MYPKCPSKIGGAFNVPPKPIPSPGERVARRAGRLRPQARAASNRRRRLLASAGIRAKIRKSAQTNRPPPKSKSRRRSSHFQNHYVTARIPLQSAALTASPREKRWALRARWFFRPLTPSNFGGAFLYPTTIDFPPSRLYNRHRQKTRRNLPCKRTPMF